MSSGSRPVSIFVWARQRSLSLMMCYAKPNHSITIEDLNEYLPMASAEHLDRRNHWKHRFSVQISSVAFYYKSKHWRENVEQMIGNIPQADDLKAEERITRLLSSLMVLWFSPRIRRFERWCVVFSFSISVSRWKSSIEKHLLSQIGTQEEHAIVSRTCGTERFCRMRSM